MQNQEPPHSNTGAENTNTEKEVLIDWISFTFPSFDQSYLNQVYDLLNMYSDDFIQMPSGAHGYKSMLRCGDISILYNGAIGMGIHVMMTGNGCRQYETRNCKKWDTLFQKVFDLQGNFTRIDVAIDDYSGKITLPMIQDKIERREIKSRFKLARHMGSIELNTNAYETAGNTIYFGSSLSKIMIRIYDKGKEQKINKRWIRFETQ